MQGGTPLHSAASKDNAAAVKWLLQHGADSAAEDKKVNDAFVTIVFINDNQSMHASCRYQPWKQLLMIDIHMQQL